MEMVLDVYQRPYDKAHPVVCIDERAGQILGETREPMPLKKGSHYRQDFEYKRKGTYTAFLMVEPLAGWRHVDIRRKKKDEDFARQLVYLARKAYPKAKKITLVLDNLSTHRVETLWKIMPPSEALEIAKRFELVFTPPHGSWLNMAELELSVMVRQSLGKKRFESYGTLKSHIKQWVKNRNRLKITIEWGFTVKAARKKFSRFYKK